MGMLQTRRGFLATASAAGLLGAPAALADEGPPETTTIRLGFDASACIAPQSIAGELLRLEGFTDIRYVPQTDIEGVARGDIDFWLETGAGLVTLLDAGKPITVLAGVHPGCYELFANEPIRTISDLKGRRVGIQYFGSAGHLYLVVMAAHVGLDPHKDIEWVGQPDGNFMELLAQGKVDAFLAFPPEPQKLRSRKIGRVILNLATDRPWSQYFCCMAYGSRAFVRDNPIATKRYLRAILRTTDFCAAEPANAARRLVDEGFTDEYEFARQALGEIPYAAWREYDPEDTLRFYALRLHELGMIKSNPNQLIAEGTDWRFLNEIKRELKS
jgi:NitT/TauT family transport system substrate-binding protein